MADKMMRQAVRDKEGKAKALAGDNEGSPIVRFKNSGLIYLHDGETSMSNGETLDVSGYSTIVVQISGNFEGTVSFMGGIASTSYSFVEGIDINGSTRSSNANRAGFYIVDCTGLNYFQARLTNITSGSVRVRVNATTQSKFILPSKITTKALAKKYTLSAGNTEVIINPSDRIKEIVSFEFSTNDPEKTFIFLEVGDERISKIADRRGINVLDLSIKGLYDNSSPLWKVDKYDDDEKAYKISLNIPLESDDPYTIRVSNTGNSDVTFAISAILNQR